MSPRARRSTVLLLAAALAATMLLAAALPRLRLSPGLPLPEVSGGGVVLAAPGVAPAPVSIRGGVLLVLATGAVLLLLWAAWRALRGVRLARLAAVVIRGVAILAAMCAALVVILFVAPSGGVRAPMAPLPPPAPAARSPLGAPPPLLLWLTAAGVLLGSALVAAWLLRPRPPLPDALDLLGLEADRARSALLAGGDARSIILACYARMSAVLAEEQRIQRPGSMTAGEFRELLASLGIPRPPVAELTRLFEAVRYGRWRPEAGEEARALACLEPIVEHCRAARQEA